MIASFDKTALINSFVETNSIKIFMKKLNLFLVFAFMAIVAKAQDFPTTFWLDVAETSWYDSSQNEFTISTAEELAGLALLVQNGAAMLNKSFSIDGNIDLDGHLWIPIGLDHNLPFSGSVEGNDYTISNLWINQPNVDFAGLFGYTSKSSISNLKIDTAHIVGFDNTGTLVANLFDNGHITNCSAINVEVVGNNNTGGLVGGFLTNSSITKSFAIGNVQGMTQVGGVAGSGWAESQMTECYAEGTVTAEFLAGGLIGAFPFTFFAPSTIDNCYSRSSVEATVERAGGLLGGADNGLNIKNSYSTGTVTSPEFAGAVVGFWGSISAENVYFDSESSGMTEAVGGFGGAPTNPDITAKTTAEMKSPEMVDLLNANNPEGPWSIDASTNDGYPILNAVLSVPGIDLNAATVVYPTVFENNFTISSTADLADYAIYSMNGQRIAAGKISGNSTEISGGNLQAGIYLLKIQSNQGSITKRIIKK